MKNNICIYFLIVIFMVPILSFGVWEYAKVTGCNQRVLIPLVDNAVDVSVIQVESNRFVIAASKYGVSICPVK